VTRGRDGREEPFGLFRVWGMGDAVALAVIRRGGGAARAILGLGLARVVLGAPWERLRGWPMRARPDSLGQSRLPYRGAFASETPA
jgi:hypothetical protein